MGAIEFEAKTVVRKANAVVFLGNTVIVEANTVECVEYTVVFGANTVTILIPFSIVIHLSSNI